MKIELLYNLIKQHAIENISILGRVSPTYSDNNISNSRYWLSYGILSSGVKDNHAHHFSKQILAEIGNDPYFKEDSRLIRNILSTSSEYGKYRFPNVRSECLHISLRKLQSLGNNVPIEKSESAIEQRDMIVSFFPGIGLKQASLFLRNLGYSYDLCVVDTHIIDFLIFIGWLPSQIKLLPLNRKRYFAIESLFKRLSYYLSLPLALLDLAVWDVTKILKIKNYI